MDWLLVVFYIFLGAFIFYKWKKLHFSGLSPTFIVIVFLLKSFLSIVYTVAHSRYYGGGDTFHFYKDGLIIYETLSENPIKYLMLCFGPNGLDVAPEFILKETDAMGYWWNNSSYMVVRFYAITNLFTHGNIYASGIFMAFLSTVGLLLLYAIAISQFYQHKKIIKLIVFGVPSIMFWTSGIHKEGLILTSLAVFFYSVYKLGIKKFLIKYLVLLLFSALSIWLIRDFVLYLLLPGAVAYWLSTIQPRYILPKFLLIYIITLIIGLYIQFTIREKGTMYKANVIESISLKQNSFKSLKGGNTAIEIDKFNPEILSIITQSPKAFFRTLGIPFYLTSFNNYQTVFVIENVLLILLLFYFLNSFSIKTFCIHSLSIWYFLFAVSLLVLIGIVVSNIGASLRYRSVPLLFFLLSFLPLLRSKNNL